VLEFIEKTGGCTDIAEMREIAKLIGIGMAEKFTSKKDIIATIQLAMGFDDCFTLETPGKCAKLQGQCMWEEDCQSSTINLPTRVE
jgi:hypothetical protein